MAGHVDFQYDNVSHAVWLFFFFEKKKIITPHKKKKKRKETHTHTQKHHSFQFSIQLMFSSDIIKNLMPVFGAMRIGLCSVESI